MPKGGTGTKHHCVGGHNRIGKISPGGCTEVRHGKLIYCKKHEMPCRSGCPGWFHLKNQTGCMACQSRWKADAKRKKLAVAVKLEGKQSKSDDRFWSPERERKRPN